MRDPRDLLHNLWEYLWENYSNFNNSQVHVLLFDIRDIESYLKKTDAYKQFYTLQIAKRFRHCRFYNDCQFKNGLY